MKRFIAGLVALTLTLTAVGALALTSSERSELEQIRADVVAALETGDRAQREALLEGVLVRIDSMLTTTTTAPTTTTTAAPTTTTTAAPTTTTAPPTTTTTTMPDPAPPTGEEFTIMLKGLDNPDTPQVETDFRFWWDAPYYRNLNSGAGWVDGDRLGYRCAWMFLEDNGRIVGRVSFVRIAYAFVSDKFMQEGVRNYDGTLNPAGGQTEHVSFCDQLLADDYTFANVPDERPIVRYVGDRVLEVRNYRNTVVGEGLTFDQASVITSPFVDGGGDTVYSRVTVLARENGNAVIAVYYDSLVPDVRMTSDLP